jgi:hypothetical protein
MRACVERPVSPNGRVVETEFLIRGTVVFRVGPEYGDDSVAIVKTSGKNGEEYIKVRYGDKAPPPLSDTPIALKITALRHLDTGATYGAVFVDQVKYDPEHAATGY